MFRLIEVSSGDHPIQTLPTTLGSNKYTALFICTSVKVNCFTTLHCYNEISSLFVVMMKESSLLCTAVLTIQLHISATLLSFSSN